MSLTRETWGGDDEPASQRHAYRARSGRAPVGPIGTGDEPGPDEADVACTHGQSGIQFPTDPSRGHYVECSEHAIFRVPSGVAKDGSSHRTAALCPFHLARFITAYPEVGHALLERFEIERWTADNSFESIQEAPSELDALGRTWALLGVDQQGYGHYLSSDQSTVLAASADAVAAVSFDREFTAERVEHLGERDVTDWLAFVRENRGWIGFGPASPVAAESGGEQA